MKFLKFLLTSTAKIGILVLIILVPAYLLAWPAGAPTLTKSEQSKTETTDSSEGTFEAQKMSYIDDSQVQSRNYLVYDLQTKEILAEKASQTAVPVASLTKLMTAYLTYRFGNMDDVTTIEAKDAFSVNPVLGLAIGDKVTVSDLFNSIMIGSANDAALALGSYLETKTGVKVADLMNNEAKNLSLKDTHFENPLGFDSDTNYSSAKDMRTLVEALSKYSDFSQFDRKQSYTFANSLGRAYAIKATNKLILRHPDIYAIKTGTTEQAQGAMITKTVTPRGSFVTIVLQSPNREQDTLLLKSEITKAYYAEQLSPAQ